MIKAALAGLVLLPATLLAWDSPQQAVEAFVQWESNGGRLQTDTAGLEKHVHLEPGYGGIGADTVLVSDAFHIGRLRCKAEHCKVTVAWHLPARHTDDALIGNGRRERLERIRYGVLNVNGDWRIDSRTLTDFPIISPQTLETHRAALAEDEAEVGDGR